MNRRLRVFSFYIVDIEWAFRKPVSPRSWLLLPTISRPPPTSACCTSPLTLQDDDGELSPDTGYVELSIVETNGLEALTSCFRDVGRLGLIANCRSALQSMRHINGSQAKTSTFSRVSVHSVR